MKHRLQGVIIGVLAMAVLFGTVNAFAATTRTIEVVFGGVRTTLFEQEFVVRDSQGMVIESLTYNARVYIPVDAVQHAMGVNVQWDETTRTLNFGSTAGVMQETQTIGASFVGAVPPYDVSHRVKFGFQLGNREIADVRIHNQVPMGGIIHDDVVIFTSGWGTHGRPVHSLHNLGGQYSTLTGYLGRVDGTAHINGAFRFYGDGNLLQSFDMRADSLPIPISLNVSNVRQLRIALVIPGSYASSVTYAFVGNIR